jgi:hypothetical protein
MLTYQAGLRLLEHRQLLPQLCVPRDRAVDVRHGRLHIEERQIPTQSGKKKRNGLHKPSMESRGRATQLVVGSIKHLVLGEVPRLLDRG